MLTSGCLFDPYIDSEKYLLEVRESALRHIREGKMLISFDGEGTSAASSFAGFDPFTILREVTTCLKQKNPQKYGYIATKSRVFFA